MKGKSQRKKEKSEMNAMFFIILIALVIFILSTYAWFTTQRDVSITNLDGEVQVAEGLEISLDAINWSNKIVLGTEDGQLSIIDDAYTGHSNISPTEMLPVSTLGLAKESDKKTALKMLRGKVTNSENTYLENIRVTDESISEAANSNYPGYFAFDVFLKNESKTSEDDILQLNYKSSLELLDSSKSTTGLQNTARVGFAKYNGTSSTQSDQATILKETAGIGVGATQTYISDVAIWEPNANAHANYIVLNNNKIKWSTTDASKYNMSLENGKTGFKEDTQIPTYALKEESIGTSTKINDIYKWDGSETLLAKQNTLQTQTTSKLSTEADYALTGGVQNLVSTQDGTTPFKITANKISRIRIYVWLEGQDVDCINWASHGGGIKVNIGLVKGSTVGATTEPTE